VLPKPTVSGQAITFSIPYYSGIDYLARAIESVLAQDDPRWQCVVADDSSEAGVEDLVKRVGRDRVRYVKNPHNLGIDGNFNRCIDVAETDLVTVLHADDELMPSYTATMLRAAERYPDAAAIFCRAEIIGPNSESWFSLADFVKGFINPAQRGEFVLEGEPGVRTLLRANFIMAPTLCFRKSVLGERRFPLGYKFVLDWELTTKILLDGLSIVGIPGRCYRYRRHLENATEKLTKTQQRFREESEFYDRVRPVVAQRGWTKCVELAAEKRMIKLNIAYRALKSAAQLQLTDARKGLRLLREL
jgi:glycosyltransferase involved in cell wall biosynthesis